MRNAQAVALTALFIAGLIVRGANDPDGQDPLPEILLVITALITLALFIRQGPLKSEDVDEPVWSYHFQHICPQCGHRMKLRRDQEKFLRYACPNCGLGMRNPELAPNNPQP